MAVQDYLEATIVEAETITVDLVDETLITVNFTTIDVIQNRGWVIETVKDCFIYNELPTKLTAKRFKTVHAFVETSLQVLFNGLKERNITIHSGTEFSLPINSISNDVIEISYIKY